MDWKATYYQSTNTATKTYTQFERNSQFHLLLSKLFIFRWHCAIELQELTCEYASFYNNAKFDCFVFNTLVKEREQLPCYRLKHHTNVCVTFWLIASDYLQFLRKSITSIKNFHFVGIFNSKLRAIMLYKMQRTPIRLLLFTFCSVQ